MYVPYDARPASVETGGAAAERVATGAILRRFHRATGADFVGKRGSFDACGDAVNVPGSIDAASCSVAAWVRFCDIDLRQRGGPRDVKLVLSDDGSVCSAFFGNVTAFPALAVELGSTGATRCFRQRGARSMELWLSVE